MGARPRYRRSGRDEGLGGRIGAMWEGWEMEAGLGRWSTGFGVVESREWGRLANWMGWARELGMRRVGDSSWGWAWGGRGVWDL